MSNSNPELRRLYNKNYYEAHRDSLRKKARVRSKAWRQVNKARRNAYLRNKCQDEVNTIGRSRNSEANKRSRMKLKIDTFKACGGKCVCCGETELEFLTIDHVNNDGAQHRRENPKLRGGGALHRWLRDNGYPKEFQVLCCNCNWSKRLGGGICVHQR